MIGTTKRKAENSHRHCDFFVSEICQKVIRKFVYHSQAKQNSSYDGLIRQNTTALVVNMPSRLFAVVETRYPFLGNAIKLNEKVSV